MPRMTMPRMDGEAFLAAYARGVRNFTGADLQGVDIPGARLEGVYLESANLRGANLEKAVLRGVDMRRANLEGANLYWAKLEAANLEAANLEGARFEAANLERANLRDANLSDANFDQASLVSVNFTGALTESIRATNSMLGRTILVDVDLSAFCRTVTNQESPSVVDHRSILRSLKEPQLKDFLRRIGMPDVFVEGVVGAAHMIGPQQVSSLLLSVFISYGGPDEAFAGKLNEALKARGVKTFFFKDDAPPGEKLHRVMRQGVSSHDRVILICSRQSLDRPGLLNELEETLAREAEDGGAPYLIPVRLDDYLRNGWEPKSEDLRRTIGHRVVVDFSRHEDAKAFEEGVTRLMGVLKKPEASVGK